MEKTESEKEISDVCEFINEQVEDMGTKNKNF